MFQNALDFNDPTPVLSLQGKGAIPTIQPNWTTRPKFDQRQAPDQSNRAANYEFVHDRGGRGADNAQGTAPLFYNARVSKSQHAVPANPIGIIAFIDHGSKTDNQFYSYKDRLIRYTGSTPYEPWPTTY